MHAAEPPGSAAGSARPRTDGSGSVASVQSLAERVCTNIDHVVQGKPGVVRIAVAVLLAEGHLLIEDVPGVGKTILSKALARSVDVTVQRIQFTPDLLPSDVTGVSIYHPERQRFEFQPGAVFANIVIADEINRASPKTQSALLECMEERQVTVDGTTYGLARPFMVVATQNPQEMEGTYALPEAQRDRFTARVSMGYPTERAEMAMLTARSDSDPLDRLTPVTDANQVQQAAGAVAGVHVATDVHRYAVALSTATRRSSRLRLGASPRATLHLVRVAKAHAAMAGRGFVIPEDIRNVAPEVLTHRLIPTRAALAAGDDAAQILESVLHDVAVPHTDPTAGS